MILNQISNYAPISLLSSHSSMRWLLSAQAAKNAKGQATKLQWIDSIDPKTFI